MVGVLPGIAEPDTTFLSDLPKKRPTVRGKQERHVVHAPRPTGRLLLGSSRIATTIAPGLFDCTGNVSALAFRFHNGHRGQANEQHVVCRSIAGGPLCYRQVASSHRAGANGVRQRLRVCFPASLTELLINDATCLGLVEIKCLSLVLCLFDAGGALRRRCLPCAQRYS
jgi:hypothetical protein